jgi:hypothetical protein
MVIGLLAACQTTQSQYVNWMKQHPEYPYFAYAETISGNSQSGMSAANSRADANANAIKTCMSASKGLQCYVTYENFNFVGQYVYQQKNNPQRLKQEEEKAYITQLQNTCTSFGFKSGTDNFANCMMNQDKIAQKKIADDKASTNNGWDGLVNALANYKSPAQQRQDAANQQPQQIIINSSPTYCRSTLNGNIVTTNCN